MTNKTEEHMNKRVDETHKANWHNVAGAGSLLSLILPVLSEFEHVGEEFAMGIWGAGAASVFVILMKIGRVSAVVGDLKQEQNELHDEETEEERKRLKQERRRIKHSNYRHDPIGWCDSELEGFDDSNGQF